MKYPNNYKLEMLSIDSLEIDERYQRDVQINSRYIGENFDPLAAGAITVGVRKNGQKFITDGLQRYTGAKAAGYKEILCLTFSSSGVVQEANLFAMLNGKHRKKVTPAQNFKARLEGKDKDAIEINRIVVGLGFQFLLDYTTSVRWPILQGVRVIEGIYEEGDLKVVLSLIKEMWEPDPHALREHFLKGFWLFYKAAKDIENFNLEKMKEKFSKIEPLKIIRNADRQMIEKSAAGFNRYKFIQLELLNIYNNRSRDKISF